MSEVGKPEEVVENEMAKSGAFFIFSRVRQALDGTGASRMILNGREVAEFVVDDIEKTAKSYGAGVKMEDIAVHLHKILEKRPNYWN